MISEIYQGIGLNAQLLRLPAMRNFQLPKNIQLSVPQKVTVVSMTVGLALLGFLARYFRRKRHGVGPPISEEETSGTARDSAKRKGRDSCRTSGGRGSIYKNRSPNGDGRALHRQPSSSIASAVSISLDASLTPQQLGVMGMEALQTAISYWEDAIKSYSGGDSKAVTSADEAEFSKQLDTLLESAYKLQYDCELLFLDQRSVLFRDVRDWVSEGSRRTIASPTDSFASAQDQVADLREFEAFTEVFPDYENLPLYKAALKHLETDGIPCRCLRTEAVNCSSNAEYLAKLYCIRLAFQLLFRQPATWVWFADTGQQILMDLLLFADKDSKGFLIAYEDMLSFLRSLGARDESSKLSEEKSPNTCTWTDVEEELASRGVKAMTFFDVVLDYILLDAFDDLDQPPSSVTAVVQNRWLSSGFKETALATAVWSLLKAKRHRLSQPNGFMAHFYAISEHISPLMAWGFLGSDEELRKMCIYFKEQVMGFLKDVFSFEQTRFTSVEELAVDVMAHARSRADGIMETLSSPIKASEDPHLIEDLIANISISNECNGNHIAYSQSPVFAASEVQKPPSDDAVSLTNKGVHEDNKNFRAKAEEDFLYQTLSSGTYAVDTFFFISGLLVSFLYFRTVSRCDVRQLTFTSGGLRAHGMQFLGMLVYRFIRLTPPYLFTLGLVELTMKYCHDHGSLEPVQTDHINCPKYWWRNVLYINTLFPLEERCMVWSWYLASDTQFYVIGTILLIIAVNHFWLSAGMVVVFMLSTWTTTALITIYTEHTPTIQDPFANYDELYDKPWTRIGPYLVGMCLGWILFKTKCKMHIRNWVLALGWTLSAVSLALVAYSLYFFDFGPAASAVYTSLSHTAWAMALAWIVLVCTTDNARYVNNILSWKYIYPLSRITYCSYLLHPVLMRSIACNSDSPTHIGRDIIAIVFLGYTVASYGFSFLISLVFEAPVVALLRLGHPLKRRKATT